MKISIRVSGAIVAWALLIWYWTTMKGIISDLNAAKDAAPEISAGVVKIATALGTGVVGVIAGLFGTAVPKSDNGETLMSKAPRRIGRTLTAHLAKTDAIQLVVGTAYVIAYLAIIGVSIRAWAARGDDLTPDFLEGQVIGAIGLLAACAVAKAGAD